jgi:hypothetical protein
MLWDVKRKKISAGRAWSKRDNVEVNMDFTAEVGFSRNTLRVNVNGGKELSDLIRCSSETSEVIGRYVFESTVLRYVVRSWSFPRDYTGCFMNTRHKSRKNVLILDV